MTRIAPRAAATGRKAARERTEGAMMGRAESRDAGMLMCSPAPSSATDGSETGLG